MIDFWSDLNTVMDEIRGVNDIKAFAIVRRDGVIVAHSLGSEVEPKVIAATTAAILATAELATEQLRQGRFLRTIVECEHGNILITDAGEQTLLVSLVFPDANLGLVLHGLEKVGRKVAEVVDSTAKASSLQGF